MAEQEKRIAFRGSAKYGPWIIAILEKIFGGINDFKHEGIDEQGFYYINQNNTIRCVPEALVPDDYVKLCLEGDWQQKYKDLKKAVEVIIKMANQIKLLKQLIR